MTRRSSIYRAVEVRVWDDEKFVQLSRPQPNAQTLWLYLLTSPHTGAFPGLFVFSLAEVAERFKWPLPATRRAFAEILKFPSMARYNDMYRIVFLPNAVNAAPMQSLNNAKAWGRALRSIPDCEFSEDAKSRALVRLQALGQGFVQAFTQALVQDYGTKEQKQDLPPTPQGGNGPTAPGEKPKIPTRVVW